MPQEFTGSLDIFSGEFALREFRPQRAFQPDPTTMLGADTAFGALPGGRARGLGAGRGGIGRSALLAGGSGRRWR